ncbi:hypothetical protein [Roseovarius sp. CH_XMU1461]|uniref:hypothetical protein n=1 Tax=Roseovarius sp. CH_XMU1461 TaxID=3107777 RepID=UPI003009833F
MKKPKTTAVALFNYAHSYAQSAVTLEDNQTEATHWNAPVYFLYFLYFHAIELYLKALLVSFGLDLDELRKTYGHRVRPLAELCQKQGLQLSLDAEQAIDLMSDTDNVITSRYIRVGKHKRLPFSVYYELCLSLHEQIGRKVYQDSSVTGRPVLKRAD